jgi:transcriptional regulator with XRE-family HTH domain
MNRFEFGALVASLRDDMRWTQLELAEKSGVDVSIISNIERGTRSSLLKDNILLKLADGFHLTTLERQEFLFAASGVAEAEVFRKEDENQIKQFDPQTFIAELGEHIGRISLPVLVTDSFCDVLLVNRCLLEFYDIPQTLLSSADQVVGGYNQMRYVFHADSNFRQFMGKEAWERYSLVNARYFRRRSLRVRYKKYFSTLLGELNDSKKYPSFEMLWRKMVFEGRDDYHVPFNIPDPEDTNAIYAVESLLAVTPFGEVYLQQILPINKKTTKRFDKIMEKVGEGYVRLAPFPDKQKK